MKKLLLLLLIFLGVLSCKTVSDKSHISQVKVIKDSQELIDMYKTDQSDRMSDDIDWSIVGAKDSLREIRIYELLDSNKVRTSLDYHNAAMIFQHGIDSTAYGMAVKCMKKSIELDSTADKWLLAAATDRYLMSKGEPQIYGTQFYKPGPDAPWEMGKMDTTVISDIERSEYRVGTLAEQKIRVKLMNSKKLTQLISEGKTIDEIVSFIASEDIEKSKYNLSERGINSFGYYLMGEGNNEEALKIFRLNTELYPNAFNTHDSYGECLLLLGQKEEGIRAYKKSLQLNPKNDNAKKVLAR